MKENKLNSIEQQLRDKLNDASFDYQEQHWTQLKSNLNQSGGATGSATWLKVAAFLVLSTAGAYYFLSDSNEPKQLDSATPRTENRIQETKPNDVQPETNSTIETEFVDHSAKESSNNKAKDVINKKENLNSEETEVNNVTNAVENKEKLSDIEEIIETDLQEETVQSIEDRPIDDLIIHGNFCIGNVIEVVIESEENQTANYTWMIGGEKQETNDTRLTFKIEKPGYYEISASNEISKKSIDFEVETLPEIDFTYQDLNDPYWDEAAQLNATPEHLEYTWNIEGIETQIQGNKQTVDFETQGLYDVELIYKSQDGCETRVAKPINIQTDFDPLAPNVFTPNGDGLNDNFIPKGFAYIEGSFKMSIYNLSGKKIYETKSKDEPWNGKENNTGSELIDGIYVWKIEISNDIRNKAFTGHVKKTSF